MSRMIGYARAPTARLLGEQVKKLQAAQCLEVFEDEADGELTPLPGLDAAMKALRPGDTLVICKIEALSSEREIAMLVIGLLLLDDGTKLQVLDEEVDDHMLRAEADAAVRDHERQVFGNTTLKLV